MHILFLTHYYPPEVNAPASRVSELARAWVQAGHAVTVVTAFPSHPRGQLYPGYRNALFSREIIDGVEVLRIWTWLAANEGFARRLASYLSYPLSLLLNMARLPRTDVVISTSPQFFCGLSGWLFQRRHRPWLLEIRDLWPESILAVGAMRKSAGIRALERIERWAYRRADAIVSVTDGFCAHFHARAPATPVKVVKNGVDLGRFETGPETTALAGRFRAEHGLENRFVAGYVGTHGMAHGLDTVLAAAERLRDRPDIVFLMVGDGAEQARLAQEAAARGLRNVLFLGQRPKSDMPAIWAALDASLIHLKRMPTFQTVLPSKLFEAMAMSKPVVLGVEGEAEALLREAGAGIAVTPEDDNALAKALVALADDPVAARRMGESGRRFVQTHFDRAQLAQDYLRFIRGTVAG